MDRARHGETWLRVNDQEWSVIMFMREYINQFRTPPAFFDLNLKVRNAVVAGKLEPDQRIEINTEKGIVIVDGVTRQMERRKMIVDGQIAETRHLLPNHNS